jgi:hypothetical protein
VKEHTNTVNVLMGEKVLKLQSYYYICERRHKYIVKQPEWSVRGQKGSDTHSLVIFVSRHKYTVNVQLVIFDEVQDKFILRY